MEHYVTLFDSLFLPQGLTLHKSMERYCQSYKLWILCVDDSSYDALTQLRLPNVNLLKLSELETTELLKVKIDRSKGEYCWTLTPFAPRFVFDADATVNRVTYLDADLWFRSSPQPIFDDFESSNKNVAITRHAYAPENDYSAVSGHFCVQFMTFTREGGEEVRQWWQDRCIEWCYARVEDGKFGDQKYLDDWPQRFQAYVHVFNMPHWFLAPWNASRFAYSEGITFHFHGLRLLSRSAVDFGSIYSLPRPLIEYVYQPYLADMKDSIAMIENLPNFVLRSQAFKPSFFVTIRKFLSAVYNNKWKFQRTYIRKL